MEDQNRLAMEAGTAAFELNYPFVYPSMKADKPDLFKHFKWALYPGSTPGKPARVTIGGIDLAISKYSPHPDLAFQAALCLRDRQNQLNAAIKGGLPPTLESLYHDPAMFPAYPFHADILTALQNASVRPQDPGVPERLHRHLAPRVAARGHRPGAHRADDGRPDQRRASVGRADPVSARRPGAPASQRGRNVHKEMGPMTTGTEVVTTAEPEVTGRRHRKQLSEGARAERRLGWLLCAPAVIVMIVVAAFPILYAVWLSLQRYDLRFPQQAHFVGLSNYGAVLSSPYWWHALVVTLIITVVSVAVEFVLGMLLALADVPHHLRPRHDAHHLLIPYGIVTVAAAYGWQYAWTPHTGYLSALFGDQRAADQDRDRDRDHHPGGGVEDHAVHGAAADGGAVAGAGRPAKAARVDGASAWQRFIRVTLPLMKPAILVALLFRTLDAFRIFDNIYILTAGGNGTYSVSILGYDNLFRALNLGIGSAISILIFICVAIIAFIFIKIFGAAAPGA